MSYHLDRFLSFTDEQVTALIFYTASDDDSEYENFPFSYPNERIVDYEEGLVVRAFGTARLGVHCTINFGGGIVLKLPSSFRAAPVYEGLKEARAEMSYLIVCGNARSKSGDELTEEGREAIAAYCRAVTVHIALAHLAQRMRVNNRKRKPERSLARAIQLAVTMKRGV